MLAYALPRRSDVANVASLDPEKTPVRYLNWRVIMNALKLISVALTGGLLGVQDALAIIIPPQGLPVDDGWGLLVAALGLVAVIKIARSKGKR